jgi:signal peptidase I
MEPTLLPGERVLVNRLAYRRHPPARGDVVLARDPREPKRLLIKRVAAIPGDAVRQDAGRLTVNGAVVLDWRDVVADVLLPEAVWRLAADEFFLLGDAADLHPAASTDSRIWGPVAKHLIVGRVWAMYWPPSRARRVE